MFENKYMPRARLAPFTYSFPAVDFANYGMTLSSKGEIHAGLSREITTIAPGCVGEKYVLIFRRDFRSAEKRRGPRRRL